MKQNSCLVAGEVATPTGIGLDGSDGAVESFSTGVSDSVLAEVEQASLVTAQCLDHLFDALQSALHRMVEPGIKKPFGRAVVAATLQLRKCFPDGPCPADLEIELVQCPQPDHLCAFAICVAFEPSPLTCIPWGSAVHVSQDADVAIFLTAQSINLKNRILLE